MKVGALSGISAEKLPITTLWKEDLGETRIMTS